MTEIKTEEGRLIRVVSYEERIAELEKEKCELLGIIQGKDKAIKDLEKENAELKEQNRSYEQLLETGSVTLMKERLKNYKQLTKAKELLKKVIRFTWGEGWNYSLGVKVEAENFLKEIE